MGRQFPGWTLLSLTAPAVLGGLLTWSWWGAATAFLWAGSVRGGVQHHVTWSTNSICHMAGKRPWTERDRSTNFWPLAILSLGESWHNLHHADPTCARPGVGRGQIDISARLIAVFERLGWVHERPLAHPAAPGPPRGEPRGRVTGRDGAVVASAERPAPVRPPGCWW